MTWTVIERRGVKPYNPRYQAIKRVIELFVCIMTTPIVVPLMIIIALAIKLDSRGPIFFVQERIGKGGRIFKIYKFRTMYHNIDDSGHKAFMKAFVAGNLSSKPVAQKTFKPFSQNQVTRVGKFLRKSSLDELPQLINVLLGEMSFVGPRPNVPWEVEAYHGWHTERLEVLPGITGLAQIRGRSNITFDEIVQYDVEYIRHQSLILDLKILWWTITSVLFGNGAE